VELLSLWLDIIDIAMLDNAWCSSNHRAEFLSLLSHEFLTLNCRNFSPFYFQNEDPIYLFQKCDKSYAEMSLFDQRATRLCRYSFDLHFWLQKKRLTRLSYVLFVNFVFDTFQGYDAASVRSIAIQDNVLNSYNKRRLAAWPDTENNLMSTFLNQFKNLTSLDISKGTCKSELVLSNLSAEIASNLKDLQIATRNNYIITNTFVELIQTKFSNLTTLVLNSNYIPVKNEDIITEIKWSALIWNNNKIICLELSIQFWTVSFAKSLVKCTNLRELTLICQLEEAPDQLLEPFDLLITHSPHLRTIDVDVFYGQTARRTAHMECVLPNEFLSIFGAFDNHEVSVFFSVHTFQRIYLNIDLLQDEVLISIGKHCTNLIRLCIAAECGSDYTRTGVTCLLLIPSLKLLLLHGCHNTVFTVSCVVVVSKCLDRNCAVNIIVAKHEMIGGLHISKNTITLLKMLNLVEKEYLEELFGETSFDYPVTTIEWGLKSSYRIGFCLPILTVL
jgi:hypothetical protein